MPNASDLAPGKRFVALFIGPKHSGKTCAECSFPQPAEVFDFDGRINGILGAPWIDRSKIRYDFFPPREAGLVERINKKCETMLVMAGTPQFDLKTVIMDSLTSECIAMVSQALTLTHNFKPSREDGPKKGRFIGPVAMSGPDDYNFESRTAYDMMAFLKSLPVQNVIVSAHVIDRYAKPVDKDGNVDPYAESVVIGEKLSVRDKIGANIGIYFDHIFRFNRRIVDGRERFYVQFRGEIACTSYSELPDGEIDITGKHFYNEVLMKYVNKEKLNEIGG